MGVIALRSTVKELRLERILNERRTFRLGTPKGLAHHKRRRLAVSFPADVFAALNQMAMVNGVSFSEQVIRITEQAIQKK